MFNASKRPSPLNRRDFLNENALGIGMVALASLLGDEKLLAIPKNVKLQPEVFNPSICITT